MQLSSNQLILIASKVVQYIDRNNSISSLDKVQEVIVMTNVDVDGRCYL